MQLVSSNDVCLSWSSAPWNYMVTTYKLLESLLLLYTRWYYCVKSTIFREEIIDSGLPASTTIWINPHIAFKQEVNGPLIELAKQWDKQAMALLGPAHHLSLYLNPAMVLPEVLFESMATGSSSHPAVPSSNLFHCPPTYTSGGSAATSGSATGCSTSSKPPSMSVAPQPHQFVVKHIMRWTAEGTHGGNTPGKVIKNLNALVENLKLVISPPSTGAGVTNQICFAFSCDSTLPDKGCDQQQYNTRKKEL
jgi:hypothetical protein